ncbi:MAG TPA: hypothetical protein VK826_13180 [Bacteroidia bacterium]|nr:hypothetical protein [Bacteroidia bacterium]
MKTSLKLIVALFCFGTLVVTGSCGDSTGTDGDTLFADSSGGAAENTENKKLPDSLAVLLRRENYSTRGHVDSILINGQTIAYNIGVNENKYKYLMLLSDIGSGSGGVNISILQKDNDDYKIIQSFFAFPDGLRKESTENIFDMNLYYKNALFDDMCPVSMHYTWSGNRYMLKGINYVNAATGMTYTGALLDQMHIISEPDLIPEFPFVKKTESVTRFNINRIDVDTFIIRDENLLLFKNNCIDEITANHVWLVKEDNGQYVMMEEVDAPETHEVVVQKRKGGHPEIIFGDTVLKWNSGKWIKSLSGE